MLNIAEFIKKIIPPSDRQYRDGFSNTHLIDALNAEEKKLVEDALISELLIKKDDLIIETLGYLNSKKSLPLLESILNDSTYNGFKSLIAASIYSINNDGSLVNVILADIEELEKNKAYYVYTLPSAFYYLSKFNNPVAKATLYKYTTHKEYLIAYNAKRFLKDMGKQHQPTTRTTPVNKPGQRKIDVYFNRLDASHQNPTNRLLHWFFVPLMVLGLLGMAWALPFPHISFIGKYNGYFNWASFVIAFAMYYYLKLSPLLSYFALFLLFGLSYGVMQLELYEKAGGPPLAMVSVAVLFAGLAGQFIGGKIEGKEDSFNDDTKLLHITPLWVLYSLTKRFGLRY